jgi:hypothetical protein
MIGLDTILRVCIKISGLVLVLLALLKSFAMTIGTPGYSGFDIYMFIQQSLILILGIYLLAGGELLIKIGTEHPANFSNIVDFNNIFALGIKSIGLVMMLKYLIALLDFLRFYLSTTMMAHGDMTVPIPMPSLLPDQLALTLLLNTIIIILGYYLFCNGRMIIKIASYKLNGKIDK